MGACNCKLLQLAQLVHTDYEGVYRKYNIISMRTALEQILVDSNDQRRINLTRNDYLKWSAVSQREF